MLAVDKATCIHVPGQVFTMEVHNLLIHLFGLDWHHSHGDTADSIFNDII